MRLVGYMADDRRSIICIDKANVIDCQKLENLDGYFEIFSLHLYNFEMTNKKMWLTEAPLFL